MSNPATTRLINLVSHHKATLCELNFATVSPAAALVLIDCYDALSLIDAEFPLKADAKGVLYIEDTCSKDEVASMRASVLEIAKVISTLTSACNTSMFSGLDEFLYQGAMEPRHITLEDVRDSLHVTVVSESQEGGV